MYPNTYLNLFPPFPRDNRVFVAMSFEPRFSSRWQNVIAPAIRRVNVNGSTLDPHRVDLRKASDSVLTEILEGIARCRFFLADISIIGSLDERPVRNANVLYEVGLAHAARLPEEVALLRSDTAELLFDVMNIRVLHYDPDGDVSVATNLIADAIVQSLKELDLRRSLAVRHAAASLDGNSWTMLLNAAVDGTVKHPPQKTVADALSGTVLLRSIDRLLGMGALRAELTKQTPESLARNPDPPLEAMVVYRITELGRALVGHGVADLGFDSQDMLNALNRTTVPTE